MNEFFNYLRDFMVQFWANVAQFFYNWIVYKWTFIPTYNAEYSDILNSYSTTWGTAGWVFFGVFIFLSFALICGLLWILFIFLRKYIRFNKRELDKEKMADEIEQLNNELYQAVTEKNKILNLKVGSLGLRPEGAKANLNEGEEDDTEDTLKEVTSRFSRLVQVDNKYKNVDTAIPEVPNFTLEELCNKFRNFAASSLGLYYSIDDIRRMFAGMGTSKFLILEGISGTGKTSLPYALGKFFVNDATICSVQPSWRDRTELIGYFNEFTKKFNETDFLRAIYESSFRKDINIIVLDEMNLARVEYYFAEFLSVMEMPNVNEWKVQLLSAPDKSDPVHVVDGKFLLGQNSYFFGTANNDDSTFTISDKVYDRAMSIVFNDRAHAFDCEYQDSLLVPYSQVAELYRQAIVNNPISKVTLDKFAALDAFSLKNFKLVFGNRIMKQLNMFIPIYVACGGTEFEGLDFFFTTKILRKFSSLNIGFLKDELKGLIVEINKLFGKNNFKMAKAQVEELIKMN